jgi:hypothetical protein
MPQLSPERIGKFEVRVALAAQSDVSARKRVEALAAWLLALWRAEQQQSTQDSSSGGRGSR